MLNFISSRWKALKTKYKKFIPFIITFIFCFNPLSAYAVDFSAYNGYNVYFSTLDNPNTSELYISRYSNGVSTDLFHQNTSYVDGVHHIDNTSLTAANVVRLTHNGGEFYFPINNDVFDYYIVGVYQSVDINDSFWPNRCTLTCLDNSGNYFYPEYYFNSSSAGIISNNTNILRGFSFYFKVDFTDFAGFSSIALTQTYNSNIVIGKNVNFGLSIVEIHKSASAEDINSIISAIQSNTSTLGSKLDFSNDILSGGNSSTGGIVSGADSSKNELESIISDYQEIENSMLDNFTLYQSDILSDVTGWSWGGLSVCANWVGDTMTSYFQNMGDFKQYIIYPLLLGIALFFIGRGSSIIGHLYRKPTAVHTDTVVTRTTVKNGNTSNTVSHTDTYRSGGVLRK